MFNLLDGMSQHTKESISIIGICVFGLLTVLFFWWSMKLFNKERREQLNLAPGWTAFFRKSLPGIIFMLSIMFLVTTIYFISAL